MDCERCGRELKSGKEVDQYHRIGSEQLKVTAYRWMGGIICFLALWWLYKIFGW